MRRIIAMCAFAALLVPIVGGGAFVFAQSEPDPMTNRFAPSTIHSLDQIAASTPSPRRIARANRTQPNLSSRRGTRSVVQTAARAATSAPTRNARTSRDPTSSAGGNLRTRRSVPSIPPIPGTCCWRRTTTGTGTARAASTTAWMGVGTSGMASAGELHGSGFHGSTPLLGCLGRPGGGVRFGGLRLLRLPAIQSWRDE